MPTLTEMVTAATSLLTSDIMLLVTGGMVIGMGTRFIVRVARGMR